MNRLHHLMKTLPANIEANSDYAHVEFAVIDYNSSDGLEDWITNKYWQEVESGKILFKRTDAPDRFIWSHSKNMSHNLATGTILCNVDADNYTGSGFAAYLDRQFRKHPNSFLGVDYRNAGDRISDTFGRIACLKKDFDALGGYDERMVWYGYDDIDFCERLKRLGRVHRFIKDMRYLQVIQHDDSDRYENNTKALNLKSVYIHYVSPFESRMIYLFDNGNYLRGTVEEIGRGLGTPTLKDERWESGSYNFEKGNGLVLYSDHSLAYYQPENDRIIDKERCVFYRIKDKEFLKYLEIQHGVIANHQFLTENMERGIVKVDHQSL